MKWICSSEDEFELQTEYTFGNNMTLYTLIVLENQLVVDKTYIFLATVDFNEIASKEI